MAFFGCTLYLYIRDVIDSVPTAGVLGIILVDFNFGALVLGAATTMFSENPKP